MKALIVILFLLQPSTTIYHTGKGLIGTGTWRTTKVFYTKSYNIDSLTNIYDTVKIYTNHGLNMYVR